MKNTGVKSKDKIWTTFKGRIYGVSQKNKGRSSTQDNSAQELVAPYACKILKVLIADGQSVKTGDAVIVIEAMKMEYNFTSPKDGTIKKVLVKAGSVVSAGTVFVEWA